jgi:phenylacetate-CoA ligase
MLRNKISAAAGQESREYSQLQMLHGQLKGVFGRSGFYQRKWKGVIDEAVQVDKIRTLQDIERLPFTTKDELRLSQLELPPLGLHLGAPPNSIVRISSTSGTTGRPLYYALTPQDKLVVWESWKNVFEAAGIGPDDRTIFGLTMGGPYGSLYGAEALEWAHHCSIPAGSQTSSARFIQLIVDLKPTVIICITNFPMRLAQQLREAGIDPRSTGIRKFIVGGEPIRAVRGLIEEEWGAKVHDMMGIGESGMLWAECERRDGMHFIANDIVHMEYIDPETLKAAELEVGTTVELVFTHLRREACPLVRYRTHDLARITALQCTCGRTGPRIEPIGRSDDMIKVRGSSIFPSAVQSLLVTFGAPVTENFRILLPRGERKFSTPLKLVVGLSLVLAEDAVAPLRARLEAHLRDNLNARTEVSFVLSDDLGSALKGPMDRRNYFVDET